MNNKNINKKAENSRMATARHCSTHLESTPYYHVVSRCVRRSFLCGEDPVTGKNFDHRKQWLVDRISKDSIIDMN